MSIKVQGQVVITDNKKGLFEQVNPGSYTTAQRDALTPAIGDIVFNSEADELQVWDGTEWGSAGSGTNGVIQPEVEVLTPLDRAGDPELTYLKSDRIVAVEAESGQATYETDTIQSVNTIDYESGVVVSGVAIYPPQPLSNLFDGDLSTFVQANNVGDLTFDVSAWGFSNVKVKARVRNTGAGFTYSVNGSPMTLTDIGNNQAEFETTISGALQTLTSSTNSQDAFWYGIYIDDVLLVNNQAILTFPTSNNFDKFAVGSLVQVDDADGSIVQDFAGNLFIANTAPVPSNRPIKSATLNTNAVNTFNGDTSNYSSTVPNQGDGLWLDIAEPFYADYIYYRSAHGGSQYAMYAEILDDTGASLKVTVPYVNQNINDYTIDVTSLTGKITSIVVWMSNNRITVWNFQAKKRGDGVQREFIDVSLRGNFIQAINSGANTINVDNGKWLGSDGTFSSSDTTKIYRDYTVSPPKDGNFTGLMSEDICAGDGNTGAGTYTLTFDTPIPVTSQVELLVYGDSTASVNGWAAGINGTTSAIGSLVGGTVPECSALQNVAWRSYGNPGTLTNVVTTWGAAGGAIFAIRVDGKYVAVPTGDTKISKTLTYDTKLTLEGSTDLAQMALGPAVMTDGVLGGSGYSQTPYTLTTTDIESVVGGDVVYQLSDVSQCSSPENAIDGDATTTANKSPGPIRLTPTGDVIIPDGHYCAVYVGLGGGQTFTVDFETQNAGTGQAVFTSNNGYFMPIFENTSGVSDKLIYFEAFRSSGYTYIGGIAIIPIGLGPFFQTAPDLAQYMVQPISPKTLTFPGDVSTNPDLRYFQAGDIVQSDWNQSQNWSDNATVTLADGSSLNIDPTFDGNINTNTGGQNGNGALNWTFTNLPTPQFSQRVYMSSQVDGYLRINNTHNVGAQGWNDVPLEQITSIAAYSGNSAYWNVFLHAIEIDGELLVNPGIEDPNGIKVLSTDLAANTMIVDGGEWSVDINNSQVWSSNLSVAAGSFDMAESQAFNANSANYARTTDDSVLVTLDINPPLNVSSSIEVKPGAGTSFEYVATVNGYDVTTTGALGTFSNTGSLSKVTLRNLDPGRTSLEYIKVDGKTLVDTSVGGDSRVEFQTPGGTGDIIEINASNNTMLLSNSNNRWIANNKAGTVFSVAAGSLGNPPAPNYLDIAFTSMNAGTTPFTGIDATLSSRTWTLETAPDKSGPWTLVNTYEDFDMTASQDGATEWTTGKPVLNQSTWYRVKVTYNSTAAESVESDYHTFKTAV